MRSYYRILTDTDNNFASDKTFFQVNCTGQSFYHGDIRASSLRHDYYLIYMRKGHINIKKPILERPLESGDIIIFEPEKHFEYFKPEGEELEYYWVHFTGYGVSQFFNQCGIEPNRILFSGHSNNICEDFQNLFEVFLSRDKFFDLECANKLSTLLLDIAKSISIGSSSNSQNYIKINQALTYIHNNISKILTINSLAAHEHMSISRFRSVFHQIMGISPQEYIILYKLNHACELMRQTDYTITEAAFAVGYSDPQYFSRVFKKYFGISPSVYKNRQIN